MANEYIKEVLQLHARVAFLQLVHVQSSLLFVLVRRKDLQFFEDLLDRIIRLEEPFLLCIREVENLLDDIGRQIRETQRERPDALQFQSSARLAPDQMAYAEIADAPRFQATLLQGCEHLRIVRRLIHFCVLALDVNKDRYDAGLLKLLDEARNRRGLAAPCRSKHAQMPGQHRLAIGGNADSNGLLSDDNTQPGIAAHLQHLAGLVG